MVARGDTGRIELCLVITNNRDTGEPLDVLQIEEVEVEENSGDATVFEVF